MFRLITSFRNTFCDLTGKQIKKGDQFYYCDETRRSIDAYEYEKLMALQKPQKPYFQRHSKLNNQNQ